MALRNNRFNAQSYIGGIAAGGAQAWSTKRKDLLKNIYVDEQTDIDDKSGVPNGYNMGALLLPLKAGGMSSYKASRSVLTSSATMFAGRNMIASAAMQLTAAPFDLEKIASLSGSSSMQLSSSATMTAAVSMSGSSAMTLSASAQLGGIIPIEASSSMTLTPDVTLTALAFMEASAGGPTPLSPEGLAQAVWATAPDDVNSGTLGEIVKKSLTVGRFLSLK